jgi:transposase
MNLFENKLCEIETEGTRYILRRNPERAWEIAASREDKLARIRTLLEQKNRYLMEHPRAKAQIAQKEVETKINKLQIADWVKVNHNSRLAIVIDENVRQEIAALDGCYVIKTDVPAAIAGAETIHERYRDLAMVEDSFRNFKRGLLKVQPTYVRTEASTRGHVFVVLLAYLLELELDKAWHKLDVTVAEGIDELGSIRGTEMELAQVVYQTVPKATGLSLQLLEALSIKLPEALPLGKVHVATRKNLVSGRN